MAAFCLPSSSSSLSSIQLRKHTANPPNSAPKITNFHVPPTLSSFNIHSLSTFAQPRRQFLSFPLPVPRCTNPTSPAEFHSSFSAVVFIKGLPQSTAEGRLRKVLSQFGEVKRVKVVREKVSKQSLGSALVWFDNEESAKEAIKEMNGKFFDGRFILVEFAKPGLSKNRSRATPFKF